MAGPRGRFVGVGMRHYRDARLVEQPSAAADVEQVWEFLRASFDGDPLRDPAKATVERYLNDEVKQSLPSCGPLVLMWSGHGVPVGRGGGVRLMTADSDADVVSGFAIGEVLGPCVYSGANHDQPRSSDRLN